MWDSRSFFFFFFLNWGFDNLIILLVSVLSSLVGLGAGPVLGVLRQKLTFFFHG